MRPATNGASRPDRSFGVDEIGPFVVLPQLLGDNVSQEQRGLVLPCPSGVEDQRVIREEQKISEYFCGRCYGKARYS